VGVNFVLAFTIWELVQWCTKHSVGILNLFTAPLWLECLMGLLLLDFIGAYVIHFLEHKVKWMWRFHAIHHMDKQVDATTANRHHPVESIFRLVFTLLAILITGPPMWLVMLYQSLSVLLSQFNHANMALPRGLDRLISWVLVSPNMHKVHHHYQMPFTDSNYGNIFSLWDNLLRTRKHLDTASITYGLDAAYHRNEADVIEQLVLPFKDPLSTPTKS
jgi:sterol desaturase/sphingolipid hydroxylase (fatty acid hydroxylase superfamily)